MTTPYVIIGFCLMPGETLTGAVLKLNNENSGVTVAITRDEMDRHGEYEVRVQGEPAPLVDWLLEAGYDIDVLGDDCACSSGPSSCDTCAMLEPVINEWVKRGI